MSQAAALYGQLGQQGWGSRTFWFKHFLWNKLAEDL